MYLKFQSGQLFCQIQPQAIGPILPCGGHYRNDVKIDIPRGGCIEYKTVIPANVRNAVVARLQVKCRQPVVDSNLLIRVNSAAIAF